MKSKTKKIKEMINYFNRSNHSKKRKYDKLHKQKGFFKNQEEKLIQERDFLLKDKSLKNIPNKKLK